MMLDRTMLEVETYRAEPGPNGQLSSTEPLRPRTDLAEIARSCLQANPYEDIKSLECEYHEGVLMLRGQVCTYYHKQLAQEAVRDIQGIESIANGVKVVGVNHSPTARKPR
ncbi:MAG: BON domain-containing protein [Planctomycetaceae bacterium]|nr:MAG: BON domain-containing protein [Planctomycetaceae bacterium]